MLDLKKKVKSNSNGKGNGGIPLINFAFFNSAISLGRAAKASLNASFKWLFSSFNLFIFWCIPSIIELKDCFAEAKILSK